MMREKKVMLHREERAGSYSVEMFRVKAALIPFWSRAADFVVEVREGPEARLTYQFTTCDESLAHAHFRVESMRLERKWGR